MVLVFLLNFFTNFISEPGKWYSGCLPLRWQTDAFFKGHLALDSSPYSLHQDLVWDQGVQQVWGLGVPAFRFLFELLAKAFGYATFPDKVTYLIACLLSFTFLIRTFSVQQNGANSINSTVVEWKFLRVACVLAVMLFAPPFISLMSATFQVYEEVVAYEYLYGLVLFALLLRTGQEPSITRMFVLATWAGLGAFVRPTLVFYGVISLALALVIAWRARMRLRILAGMMFLFCFGIALLCYTNWVRFGAIGEFGHTFNICGNDFFTFTIKFGCPFQTERIMPAMMDNLGSLFFVQKLNGEVYYLKDFFLGESQALRIHHMYFSTFDWHYLWLFIGAGLVWVLNWKRLLSGWSKFCTHPTWSSGQSEAQQFSLAFTLLGIPWAAASFACLFGFYLRCPIMTSRYTVDFLPAIAVGISALIWNFFEFSQVNTARIGKTVGVVTCALTAGWLVYEINSTGTTHFWNDSLDQQAVSGVRTLTPAANTVETHRSYEMGKLELSSQLYCNGMGWDLENGVVMPMVQLFASDPECVKLKLFLPEGRVITPNDLAPIQVKIGLERLVRESAQINSNKATLVFQGPKKSRYQSGLQVCFIAFIPPQDLGSTSPSVCMSSVSFTRTEASFATDSSTVPRLDERKELK